MGFLKSHFLLKFLFGGEISLKNLLCDSITIHNLQCTGIRYSMYGLEDGYFAHTIEAHLMNVIFATLFPFECLYL
jgi:hypothetical protein